MSLPSMFHKNEQREFFAHHMLLHAAALEIAEAEAHECGRFNKCLAAMVMTALAVEALVNAVGKRTVLPADWPTFERLPAHEKMDRLVDKLSIGRDTSQEPWTGLVSLGAFRNDIVHAKPEDISTGRVLPEAGLSKTAFSKPLSRLEREITLGNARRAQAAVIALMGIFTDALPVEARFSIYADMWSGSTSIAGR